MDSIFWVGLLIGALISVPMSIASNLWTDPVRDYLLKRRTLRLSKQKSKELRDHTRVRLIAEGHPLAMLTIQGDRDFALRMMIYSAQFVIVGIALVTAAHFRAAELDQATRYGAKALGLVTIIASGLASLTSSAIASHARNLITKAHNIEQYESEIRNKWGDDAI